MIDYHLHLVPHGSSRRIGPDDVRAYAQAAGSAGLREIAITEHLYRFPDVQALVGQWWEHDPRPHLREQIEAYFRRERLVQPLGEYVDAVLEAAADPVEGAATIRLGLEVDLFPGRMDAVRELLASYPFDVLLGAVHWIGAWGLDQLGDPVVMAEWDDRDPDDVWLAYVDGVEEVASSGTCDVLAHVDLAKLGGVMPRRREVECRERMVKAASVNGLAVEINTAGWRKPIGEAYPAPPLLRAFRDADVCVTLSSDAHEVSRVAERISDAADLARAAGYSELLVFERRRSRPLPLPGEERT